MAPAPFRLDLCEDGLQGLDARRQRVAVIVDSPAQQSRKRVGFFLGKIEHHDWQMGPFTKGGQPARSATGKLRLMLAPGQ